MVGLEHACFPDGGSARTIEQCTKDADRRHGERELLNAGYLQGLGQKADDLGVSLRTRLADALDTHLGDLACFCLTLAFRLAEDALGIAEAHRIGLARKARCAHTRNLKGDVGAHGQKIAAGIEELKGGAGEAAACTHDVHDLKRRRFDGKITAVGKELLNAARNALADDGLLGQDIAKTRGCYEIHVLFLLRKNAAELVVRAARFSIA